MGSFSDMIARRVAAMVPKYEDAAAAMTPQMRRILERTRSGMDVQGQPFKDKKDGSRSTLSKTGLLQRSIRLRIDMSTGVPRAEICVDGPAAKYAPYVNQVRPFMGVSDSDHYRMMGDFVDSINRRIRRA